MIDRLLSISAYNQQEAHSERRVSCPELIEIILLLFLRVDIVTVIRKKSDLSF